MGAMLPHVEQGPVEEGQPAPGCNLGGALLPAPSGRKGKLITAVGQGGWKLN